MFSLELKLLDSTLSNELLTTLFNEMKDEDGNWVTLRKMIEEFDVYKRESKFLKLLKKIILKISMKTISVFSAQILLNIFVTNPIITK
mgnify:CR=1 FL=1|jgi:hypothetical protein